VQQEGSTQPPNTPRTRSTNQLLDQFPVGFFAEDWKLNTRGQNKHVANTCAVKKKAKRPLKCIWKKGSSRENQLKDKWTCICTVGTESIQTPLHFSLFVSLQPFTKIKKEIIHKIILFLMVWILMTMWYFSFSFLINLQKCLHVYFFLSSWGAEWTLLRDKIDFFDFRKWLQWNKEWII